MKTYSIYHIPYFIQKNGNVGKIGCSSNPSKRVKEQGYNYFEILETHTDIYTVSEREIELQKQYDYPVDKVPYWKSIESRTEAGKIGGTIGGKIGGKIVGKIQGKKNVETGHLQSISSKGGKTSIANGNNSCLQYWACPDGHITTTTRKNVYCRNRNLDVNQCIRLYNIDKIW